MRPSVAVLSLAGLLPAVSARYQDFNTNCTIPLPGQQVNYADGPNVRGTMGIIWTCLAVLLLCVWNIQHLSVPNQHRMTDETGRWDAIKASTSEGLKKAKWMGLMVLFPEYLFGKAVCEHCAAQHSVKRFTASAARRGLDRLEEGREPLPWTLTHGYFSNMRGFVLRFEAKTVPMDLTPVRGSKEGKEVSTITEDTEISYIKQTEQECARREAKHWEEYCKRHGTDAPFAAKPEIGGNKTDEKDPKSIVRLFQTVKVKHGHSSADAARTRGVKKPGKDKVADVVPNRAVVERVTLDDGAVPKISPPPDYPIWTGNWSLNSQQMYYAYETGLISEATKTRVEEIKDRSKGDGLSKGLTILQISWLVIQIIARASQGLAITLLEVTVLAFATTGIAIYFVIWDKPQSVKVPIFVDAARMLTRKDTIELAARAPRASLFVNEFWLYGVNVRCMAENIFPHSPGIRIRLPRWAGGSLPPAPVTNADGKPMTTTTTTTTTSPTTPGAGSPFSPISPQSIFSPLVQVEEVVVKPKFDVSSRRPSKPSRNLTPVTPAPSPSPDPSTGAASSTNSATDITAAAVAAAATTAPTATAPPPPPPRLRAYLIVNPILFGLGLGGAIFGAVHCAAWNFIFPSPVEQLLWRISCLVLVAFPIVSALFYWGRQHVAERWHVTDLDWTNKVLTIVCPPIVILYVFARFYLLVEVFRALAYPEPSVFREVDWAGLLPHLG